VRLQLSALIAHVLPVELGMSSVSRVQILLSVHIAQVPAVHASLLRKVRRSKFWFSLIQMNPSANFLVASQVSPITMESLAPSPPSSPEPSPVRAPIPTLPEAPQFAEVDRRATAAFWRGEMLRARCAIAAEKDHYQLAERNYSLALGERVGPAYGAPF
jgi:hypothetical protein